LVATYLPNHLLVCLAQLLLERILFLCGSRCSFFRLYFYLEIKNLN